VALRYGLLAAGAVLVVGLGVYLFFEVRARPAAAHAPPRAVPAREAPAREAKAPAIDAEEDAAPPAGARAIASRLREPPAGDEPRQDGEPPPPLAPQKLDAIMNEANKAYDRGDLDEARSIARRVLAITPTSVRMLRIVVSASCISGDVADAQAAYVQLPKFDRDQMKTRCGRYGVSFTDP
jgi:hypothetical protein